MISNHPITDVLLWVRTLAGVALILAGPGWLLLARHVRTDPLTRLVFALATGLLASASAAVLATVLHIPWNPWITLAAVSALAWGLGRWPGFVATVEGLWSEAAPMSRPAWLTLAGICLLFFGGLVIAFADFAAPPHLIDTANHAFLVERVAEAGSIDPHELFGPPFGAPDLPYLVGWHAAIVLVARVGGVAPYLAMWLTVLFVLALLPASLAWMWRRWGLPAPGLMIAAIVIPVGHFTPLGIVGFGGFGILLASFAVPPLAIGLTNWLRNPSTIGALLLGTGLGALLHIHASEFPVVGAMAFIGLGQARAWPAWRTSILRLPWMLLAFGLIGHEFFLQIVSPYTVNAVENPGVLLPAGKILEDVVQAAGRWELLRGLWPLALLIGLRPRSRAVAVGGLALSALAVTFGSIGDPVSRLLVQPFYHLPRVLYLLMFVIGPLIGWLALSLVGRLPQRARTWGLIGLGAAIFFPAQPEIALLYQNMRVGVPFSASDVDHARRIAEVVPEDAWVANVYNDGSTWAMLISGRRFLTPARWDLGPHPAADRDAILGLLAQPWPAATTALAGRGVAFVYASRTRVPDDLLDPRLARFSVDTFDRDPRFVPRLVSADAVLYAIDWDARP